MTVHLSDEDKGRFLEAIAVAFASLKDGNGLHIYCRPGPERLRQAMIAALSVEFPNDVEGGPVLPDRVDLTGFLRKFSDNVPSRTKD